LHQGCYAVALLASWFGWEDPIHIDPRFLEGHRDTPFIQWTREPFVQGSGEENDLRAVALDERNRVWVGSHAGLFRLDRDHLTPVGAETIAGPVFCLHGHPKSGIWVGAWNGVYRVINNQVERLGNIDGPITAIGPGGTGMLVANPTGLYRWDEGTRAWVKRELSVPTSIRRVLPGNRGVYELIATDLGFFECDGKVVKRVFDPGFSSLGSGARDVIVFSTDRVSEYSGLWFASSDGLLFSPLGLARFKDGPSTIWRATVGVGEPVARSLPTADLRRLHGVKGPSVEQDAIWVGTGSGLVQIGQGSSPRLFHSQRWLPSDDVRDLVAGPDRSIWVATAGGLAHLVPKRMTLEEKAGYFEEMIQARHIRPPGLVERCQLEKAGDLTTFKPVDTDNDGEYTGTYLAAETFRFAVTADPKAKAHAVAALEAMAFLEEVTGGDGFIARTVIPSDWTEMADANRSYTPAEIARMKAENPREKIVERRWRISKDLKWLWKGDTSSDEVTGHFYAYDIFAEFVADAEQKKKVTALVARIADRLIRDGYVLKDEDGEATLWGVWSPEKLNGDPNWMNERGVNSVEILSYLTTAHWLTGDAKYDEAIESLLKDHHYDQNILSPRPSDVGAYTYIDDELLAMAYWGLIRHETKPDRLKLYRQSIDRWFSTVSRDASPLYNFTYATLIKANPIAFAQTQCISLLQDVPLDMIHWSIDNTRRMDVQLVNKPQADRIQTDRLLPPSEIPVLRWDNNPYVAAGGEGGMAEMCPAFWLWPYWMGRWQGIIGEVAR
jgi:hypothetical protein